MLERHHKKYRSRGGSDEEINIALLCMECHKAVHNAEENTKRYRTHSWQAEGQIEEDV
jgi:5-methylcytosine-specific restriction endonuclease McrA